MKAIVIALCGLALAGAAHASPCGQKIAALQTRFAHTHATGDAAPDLAGTAPETAAARLHHQPTEGSVTAAEGQADSSASQRAAHFQVEIEEARAAEDSGDVRGCEAAVAQAEKSLAP
jgi:hypothetical protein